MNRVTHIVGARPNFMKAAPVVAALGRIGVAQDIVHTGQHYDERLSDIFFDELAIPAPRMNLGVGSGTHAEQTAEAMVGLERAFLELRPALVVVYGDVNSTIAAALVAAKLHIPVAHVEAGLRSFDLTMPEEVNRRLTDQLCDLLFVTSPEGLAYLADEGIDPARCHFVGNPMIDTLLHARSRLDVAGARAAAGIGERYGLVTLHRPSNVDDPGRARDIVAALSQASQDLELVFPVHPRGRERLAQAGAHDVAGLLLVEPLGYLDFLALMSSAQLVITDSGGVQEETTILGVPCLTVRPNTERPVTITHGTNRLVEPEGLAAAAHAALTEPSVPTEPPPLWDGAAGPRIAARIGSWLR